MAWWPDPLEEPEKPDELGELDGDWSWSPVDELELLVEPEVELLFEPPELEPPEPLFELDDELPEWPAYAAAAVADSAPVSAIPPASTQRVSRETRCSPWVRALIASSRIADSFTWPDSRPVLRLPSTERVWAVQI